VRTNIAISRRVTAAALFVTCLLLPACSTSVSIGDSGGPDLSEVESRLLAEQKAESPDLVVEDATCPDDVTIEKGATFECTVSIEGIEAPYTVTVTENDSEAETASFHFEPAKAIIDVSIIVDFIQGKVSGSGTVDCGDEKVVIADVGDTIDCTVSDGNDSFDAGMVVKDLDGTVAFKK
jgi:hypothetical protein